MYIPVLITIRRLRNTRSILLPGPELIILFLISCQVATALLVAGSTPTFWIPHFISTSSYSSIVQALGCSHNCRRLTYGSFQLTHMSHDHAVQLSHGGQNKDTTLLQRSQCCHNGEFQHVSISTRQWSLRCGQYLRGPFLRATLPMRVGSCARAMADNGETKGLTTPPSRWVSAQLLCVCVTAR